MRNRFRKPAMLIALFMGAFLIMGVLAESAHAVPVFARKYGTSCNTCHIVAPRLSAFGMAFKRNGYFWPGGDDAARKIKAVEMGNTHWGARSTIDESIPLAFWMTYTVFEFKTYGGDLLGGGTTASKVDWGGAGMDLFSAGTFGDRIGYIMLVADFALPGGTSVEAAQFIANDLGMENLINIRAGYLLGGPARAQWSRYENLSKKPHKETDVIGATTVNWVGLELYGFSGFASGGGWGYGLGIVNNMGGATSKTAGKVVWFYADIQIGGMRLDGKGGAKHAQSWRDDHVRVRPYVIYGSQDAKAINTTKYSKLMVGGEVEALWNFLAFHADFQYASWKNGATGVSYTSTILAASLDAILMNGTLVIGARAETDLSKDAGYAYTSTGQGTGTILTAKGGTLGQKRPFWLIPHITTQLRSNLILTLVADINLSDVAANNALKRSHTIDNIYLEIKAGW